MAAEKEDGEVERLIQASGARTCQEMLVHSAAKHIKENHLWFSIFFRYIIFLLLFLLKLKSQLFVYMTFFSRSHRSRYTRLQRTSTAFAILFLAMLADAMWYGIVPEEKTGQGFTFGFLTLTPAEAFIGCMVCMFIYFNLSPILVYKNYLYIGNWSNNISSNSSDVFV